MLTQNTGDVSGGEVTTHGSAARVLRLAFGLPSVIQGSELDVNVIRLSFSDDAYLITWWIVELLMLGTFSFCIPDRKRLEQQGD
jgi:hypothetical protein